MELIKGANLALRFLLELCALGALGYWGFKAGNTTIAKIALGWVSRSWPPSCGARSCLLRRLWICQGPWSWFFKRWFSGRLQQVLPLPGIAPWLWCS
jgi:hypothetical protein